jgi:N-acetylglucosamine kinase-like BadF-type ATPase
MILDLQGRECGSAVGESALVHPGYPLGAAQAIATVVSQAVEAAGGALPVEALWSGIAGAGHPTARKGVEEALQSMEVARAVYVGMDVEAAHYDAFGSGPGLLLVVGTGCMAFGRDRGGEEIRVGGWGSLVGAVGCGYWVGLKGLQAVIRAADGRGEDTSLSSLILDAIGATEPHDVVLWAAEATKSAIAALAPLVLQAAETADSVAMEVRSRALEELRLSVERALESLGPFDEGCPVALAGGLMTPDSRFRELMVEEIVRAGGTTLDQEVLPVRGAATLALELVAGTTP